MLWILMAFLTGAGDSLVDTLDPVVVVATRSPVRYAQAPFRVSLLSGPELLQSPMDLRLVGGNVREYGGVPWGLTTLQIQGSRSHDVQVLVNGFPYHPPQGESADWSGVAWSMVESVEVLKTGASGLYGGQALAGVVNLKVRPLMGFRMETWVAGGQHWVRVGGGNGRWAVEAEGGEAGKGIRMVSGGDVHWLEGWLRSVRLPPREGFPQEAIQDDARLWVGYRSVLGELGVLLTRRAYRAGLPLPDTSVHHGGVVQVYREFSVGSWAVWGEGLFRGVVSTRIGRRFRGEGRQGIRRTFSGGWYVEGSLEALSLPWSLQWSTRLAWQRDPLEVHVYRATKAPSMDDLFWPRTLFAEGNPNLRTERSWGGAVILSREGVEIRGFFRRSEDLILWGPEERGIWRPRNVGQTWHAGVEVDVQGRWGRFYGQWARHRDGRGKRLPYRPEKMLTLQIRYGTSGGSALLRVAYTGVQATNWAATRFLLPRLDLSLVLRLHRGGWSLQLEAGRLLASLRIPGYIDNTQGTVAGYPLPSPFFRGVIRYTPENKYKQ